VTDRRLCCPLSAAEVTAQNVAVGRLTLVLCIREALGSNLDPETAYPDCVFSWFSVVTPDGCWDSTLKLGYDNFFHILSNS